jgi:hypothetical protein
MELSRERSACAPSLEREWHQLPKEAEVISAVVFRESPPPVLRLLMALIIDWESALVYRASAFGLADEKQPRKDSGLSIHWE